MRGARRVRQVELVDREPEAAGIAADLVQGEQPDVAVERGVLDPFGHHRTGRLLEARHELVVARLLEQQHASEPLAREAARSPRGRQASTRPLHGSTYVRYTGSEASARGRSGTSSRRRSRSTSGSNVVVACSSFASNATSCEGRVLAGELGQERLAARVDEQRLHVVQELVAGRPLRPASRAAPRPARGSSRPRRARRPRRAAARGSRAGRRARRGGRSAARRRGPRARARARAGASSRTPPDPRRGPRRARRRRRSAGARPCGGRCRRTARAARASRQNAFSSSLVAMWLGTMSRMTPSPAAAQRAQGALPAELPRDPGRVDDVVAVRRAGARLQHRREVQVADRRAPAGTARARARRRSVRSGESWSR